MTTSSPSVPPLSSFDPAIHLHSEQDFPEQPPLPSENYSDDIEALQLVREDLNRNKVVIQHRAWNLSDVFRSDEDIRPVTPTKPHRAIHQSIQTVPLLPSSPPVTRMPFISSAVFPPSSPTDAQKRKNSNNDDDTPRQTEPKRQRIMGGFVDEDDEDEDGDNEDAMAAFGEAHLASQFDIPERPSGQQTTTLLPESQPLPETLLSETPKAGAPKKSPKVFNIKTCSGKTHKVPERTTRPPVSYERLVAGRSTTEPGKAKKSYYGIEIHSLLDDAAREMELEKASRSKPAPAPPVQQSIERPVENAKKQKLADAMWTEKYRARKFTDLIGDERTHRSVLRWFKGWNHIVFPGLAKAQKLQRRGNNNDDDEEERHHRKVMLLCGPPGLGKTTLAHVCARQAGYEVLEINASDERSKDVVKGRIRDALGTENVKGMNVEVGEDRVRKVGRPVCVVVDEVDGVVSGSGGSSGEGGFMKALIDLVMLDQKNSSRAAQAEGASGKKKKGDNFRFLRPLILVCNDVYHPSLRPLRASSIAEMIHIRQAPLENVVSRMKNIFSREGIPCENDGVRKLCEASWGLSGKKQRATKSSGAAEGDIRSVLVASEWVAYKLRGKDSAPLKLTKNWLEQNVLSGSSEGGSFFRGLNRGSVRDIVDRVFTEGAGFPDTPVTAESFRDPFAESEKTPVGVADLKKRRAINRLCEMVDASGDHDRCITECFASYPAQTYQDDTYLSKPNMAYDWLHFHDTISSKVFSNQDWELNPYLSHSVAAFHHLFASARGKTKIAEDDEDGEGHPFSGPRAEFAAFETQKQNSATVTGFVNSLSAPLTRLFRSTESIVIDLVPNLMRILSPDVKPVVVRGNGEQKSVASVRKESERALVQAAVRAMMGLGVTFEKIRVEGEGGAHGGFVYRMEPPLDSLVTFSKTTGSSASCASGSAPVRYAVRQVLDQEYRKEVVRKHSDMINSSAAANSKQSMKTRKSTDGENENSKPPLKDLGAKRDFFGRIIEEPQRDPAAGDGNGGQDPAQSEESKAGSRVWLTYHDGYSNAVRKPISMAELLAGL